MSIPCTRSISFVIPGTGGSPGVQVSATAVGGTLAFTVKVLGTAALTADLRGFFFNLGDDAKLAGLDYSGTGITDFDTVNVIDLGHGANMRGAAAPFDVGLEFGTQGIGKDDIQMASFVLSNSANDLTLEDIAHVQFGARLTSIGSPGGSRPGSSKLVTVAPAAPDARDDSYGIFEDGQAGLGSPSTVPAGTIFEVLANDSDADADTLSVTEVFGALHGTVSIVDGADADSLAGDALLYTPFEDYSGTDSFTYCISDNNGGTDFATVAVAITAVADVPALSHQILAGASADTIIVRVTATQTDADSSEFIDRIVLSGIPAGVMVDNASYDPADEPGQVVRDFVLTLPLGQDTNFNLGITAVARETSNGDEQAGTVLVPIKLEYNLNELDTTFTAADQSIWDTGDAFTFTDDRFLGINTSWDASAGSFVFGATDGHLKAGFQSTLDFSGGEVDAALPFDINVETNYNKTTDVLMISADALLKPGGGFSTQGPEGSYNLDFIFDFLLNASAGVDFGVDSYNIIDVTLGPINVVENILNLDSSDLSVQIPLPAGFSLTFAWPNIDTSSMPAGANAFGASGASNNFLELGLDVDDLIFTLLGLPNPFDVSFDIGVASGNIQLADLDLSAGLNFLQDFSMTLNGLPGTITYESGASQAFVFGSDIVLATASSYDSDLDGQVEFQLSLDPNVSFNNDTDLGFNLGYVFDVLKLNGGYDIGIDSGPLSLGPVFSSSDTFPITAVGVYDNTFALDFGAQNLTFAA